jgi:5'-nucleotidase
METIHIYHTNDIHSHFENWPQINRLLIDKRKEHEAAGDAFYLFDIGDNVDRSHAFTEGTKGKGNIRLLNEAGYDAVTIGNNEGITMSKEALSSLYDDAEFDVILGNLLDLDGEFPHWAIEYKIFETDRGTRIGVIGATALYTQFYATLGWKILPPREKLIETAEKIASKTDILICLSHMGLTEDKKLVKECPLIHVILGAHTHHLFTDGEFVENTLLAATGKYGDYTGHVTIELDEVTKQITNMEATLYPSETLPVNDKDVQKLNEVLDLGKLAMQEKIFYNPSPLKQNLFAPSPLSAFFGRALIDYTKADCAMFNAGIFLGSLDNGWVTRENMHSLLPHPINVCVISLEGTELLEIHELSLNEDWPKITVKGLGFRGALMGAMLYERLYKNRHGQLFAGNREVVPGEIYTLATLDMFTFGFFFPSLQYAKKEYYMPELIRDIASDYGRKYFKESTAPPEHNL